MSSPDARIQPKQHFEILDGLRGVAAMVVVLFHVCETWNGGDHARQIINHGYLAVDFFFLLSGFVMAYAYDDRWHLQKNRPRMTLWGFFKRRLIRLQPHGHHGQSSWRIALLSERQPQDLSARRNHSCVEAHPHRHRWLHGDSDPISMDIRGWQEMHPLAGTAWSLFFEYIANIAYALGLRKTSNRVLLVLAVLSAVCLTLYLVTTPRGDITGGWSVNITELKVGVLRLLYPFLAGMLLQRMHMRIHVRRALLWCSLLLLLALILPRFGTPATLWKNGLYEALVIILLFPMIVAMGSGEQTGRRTATRLCRFLGSISYPLYITHYALIYIYTAWVYDGKLTPAQGVAWGAALFVTALAIAYACLKLYDEPVRRWLSRRFLGTVTTAP
jgi:peptidoglycan/LPS O-acetylase OafA/YrhL